MRVKDGRRNNYVIDTNQRLRHPIDSHCKFGELLATILTPADFKTLMPRSGSTNHGRWQRTAV